MSACGKETQVRVVLVQKHAATHGDVILPLCNICMALFSSSQLELTHFTPHQLPASVYFLYLEAYCHDTSSVDGSLHLSAHEPKTPPAAPTLTPDSLCGQNIFQLIFQQISQRRCVCSAVTGRANRLSSNTHREACLSRSLRPFT